MQLVEYILVFTEITLQLVKLSSNSYGPRFVIDALEFKMEAAIASWSLTVALPRIRSRPIYSTVYMSFSPESF